MDRRHFLKDTAQAGVGLGVSGSLLGRASDPSAAKTDDVTELGSASLRLDGQWLIATDAGNVGREQKWSAAPIAEAKSIRVPSIIQEVFPGYHGVAWYGREFVAPPLAHPQGRYLLRFERVDYEAEVWVNGVSVGKHEGPETPFVLDATSAVKPKEKNWLAVRVLNPSNDRIDGIVLKETPHQCKVIPFSNGAMFDYGGLCGSVELAMAPAVRIENIFARPDWKTGKIRIQATVHNALEQGLRGRIQFKVAPAATGETLAVSHAEQELPSGDKLIEGEVQVEDPRLWDLDDPYLYRVTVGIAAHGSDEVSVRCGFRDFRVEKGYFRLNGKRLFLRSAHTINHCPVGQIVPPPDAPDLLRRDMLYAKASGFNTVRFISGIAPPSQLDLCDEIGLMVYQETMAGWELGDSPQMKERYDRSIREMVLRDRNHPSVVLWGMLNETREGPVFREAVAALQIVRSLDDTRAALLGSGRWDGQLSIGSVSNPGSMNWDHVWGNEAHGGPSVAKPDLREFWMKTGDVHFYPEVPQSPETDHLMRTLGEDASKPVFLSEYGIGSMMNVIHNARRYEQAGTYGATEDYLLMRSMADRLVADWNRWGMDGVYPFPEDLVRASEHWEARHRTLGFNVIRSNPRLCGFNLTSLPDPVLTDEGVWGFWRDWKPGVMDALRDGWAPVRWCLFVNPAHAYVGRGFKVEAVLANEDVLRPGEYPVRFRICGPKGIAWERQAVVRIPATAAGEDGPLAIPVLEEEVTLRGPAGEYRLVADMEQGGAPAGRTLEFYLSDSAALPQLSQKVTVWGVDEKSQNWLKARGVTCEPLQGTPSRREIILVGDVSKAGSDEGAWKELAGRMARGSSVIFLSHEAFARAKDSMRWLPLAKKGRCYKFGDWLYHKECVAKAHPVFEGLQAPGILNWYYYGPVIPHFLFEGQETPSEVIAAAFAAGYSTAGGYASGILMGSYRFGEGRFVVNTIPVLENLDSHPAADRLLLNLVADGAGSVSQPLAALPADFEAQLKAIGY